MWIVLCACGGVRVGEAGHPGPGFDDPEIETEVESEPACGVDECTTDQLWDTMTNCSDKIPDPICIGPECGMAPFIKCQRFEGQRAGYVFKLDGHGLGYYVDGGRSTDGATGGVGLDSCEWPKYMAGLLEYSLSLPEGEGG